MTITEAESGLSSADYAAIPDETGSLAAEVVVQRYGPVWEDHPNDTDNGRSGDCFDAILVGQYLLRAYGSTISQISAEYLPSEVAGVTDASWTNVDCTAIADIDYTIPISLVSGTSPLARLFYVDTDGVLKYSECTDIVNNAFGVSVVVCSPSDSILRVAATSTTRVHYVTETSESNRRLHYAEYDVSWSTTDSEVYWPFPIYGFDAVAVDDEDVLLLTSELPPLIGSRVVGAEVQKDVDEVQGLVTFRVKNARWSDWLLVDVIDRIPDEWSADVGDDPSRNHARLSYHNNLLFGAYARAGGDGDYQYNRPAVIRSADGANWEFPELIPDGDTPFVIIPRAEYLYLVSVSGTLRSVRCVWAGQTPIEYDITSRILQTESQAAEIRQSNASAANPPDSTTDVFEGILAGELPLVDDRLLLKYSLGYHIGGVPRPVQVSLEDVIQRGEQRGMPNLNLALGSQDYLGRVNRVRSDYAAEWPSMQCGRDPFEDQTGTGYGGLRHMAPIKPSFKADNGILELVSHNKEGIAVSTFVSDALCGSAQCSFDLVNDDQDEYAFIAFRVFDKDNLYYVAYHPDENYFLLIKRVGYSPVPGVDDEDIEYTDETLGTSEVISDWSSSQTDEHWMKVWVRYNKLILYRSDDGLTWTTVSWTDPAGAFVELPGHTDVDVVWSGRFGVGGYCYSDEDTWDWTPTPWPGPTPPPESLPDVPPNAFIYCRTHILRTPNFDGLSPNWTDITSGIRTSGANPNYGYIASFKLGHDYPRAWVVTCKDNLDANDTDANMGVWTCEDVRESPPDWQLVLSQNAAQAFAAPANAACGVVTSAGQYRSLCAIDGAVYIVEAKAPGAGNRGASIVLVSQDDGASWVWSPIHSDLWNFTSACHTCPGGSAHPGSVIIGEITYAAQHDYKPCHAIVRDSTTIVAIAQLTYDHTGWCNDEGDYWYPCPYPSTGCTTFITAHRGSRSVVRYGGSLYGAAESGPANEAGVLYRLPYLGLGSQIIDSGLHENYSYVPIAASYHAMYWCKGMDSGVYGTYANDLRRNGVLLLDSPTVFGAQGGGINPGQFGFIYPWTRAKSDGLIIVRKDPVSAGDTKLSKRIVVWHTGSGGVVDKTGDLHVVLGANGWSGTGLRGTPGAVNYSYRLDNVGAEGRVADE